MTPATIFPTKHDNALTLQVERFKFIHKEVFELGLKHFTEIETRYRGHGCNPDFPAYFQQEDAGHYILFTARDEGKLVGHMSFWVTSSVHMQGVSEATDDFLYVLPEYRKQGVFTKLYHYAEDCLRALGVQYIGMSSKAPVGAPDSGPMLEKHGFRPVAVYYSKQLTRREG